MPNEEEGSLILNTYPSWHRACSQKVTVSKTLFRGGQQDGKKISDGHT
jgi:hypothetical protein